MRISQVLSFIKRPGFILALILAVFFLKGLFGAALLPIFKGQDEARHYNTIQHLIEPKEKTWTVQPKEITKNKDRLDEYNFSEEIKNTVLAADLNIFRGASYEKFPFAAGPVGKNEAEINSRPWRPWNKFLPADTAGGQKIYHLAGARMEKFFADRSILVRFYLIRIFSVLLGTLFVFISYFIMKNIGFSSKESLIAPAIIAFQPKFSSYVTNINYDALLILLFGIFTLAGILSLKNGLNWKNGSVMLASATLGIFTKGTALVLLPVLAYITACHFFKKSGCARNRNIFIFLIAVIIAAVFLQQYYDIFGIIFFAKNYSGFGIIKSLGEYLSRSLPKIYSSSKNYWGNLEWTSGGYSEYFVGLAWLVEFFAFAGLAKYLFSRKKYPELPEKKYVYFLLFLILALQAGVRFYDWSVFSRLGTLELGTPGRYFLPSLAAHIALVLTGLKAFFPKKEHYEAAAIFMFAVMFSFSMYLLLDVMVPRFYL